MANLLVEQPASAVFRLDLTALPSLKQFNCNLIVGVHSVEDAEAMIRQNANWPAGGVLVIVLPEKVVSAAEGEEGSDCESKPATPNNVSPLLPLIKSALINRTGKRDTLQILEGLGIDVGPENADMTIGCLINGTFAGREGKVKGVGQGIGKEKPLKRETLHPQVNKACWHQQFASIAAMQSTVAKLSMGRARSSADPANDSHLFCFVLFC